jgi:hypothetical protein
MSFFNNNIRYEQRVKIARRKSVVVSLGITADVTKLVLELFYNLQNRCQFIDIIFDLQRLSRKRPNA